MCHSRPKNNFAGEHVFRLQSVRDLRINSRFDIVCMKKSDLVLSSKTGSFVPHGPQTENVLSCKITFGAEIAHDGFFLCTSMDPNSSGPYSDALNNKVYSWQSSSHGLLRDTHVKQGLTSTAL